MTVVTAHHPGQPRTATPFARSARGCEHAWLRELTELLRFPTISSDPRCVAAMEACAQWLARHLHSIGMQRSRIISTAGSPLVYAEWRNAPTAPTLLIYGHYDVQSPEPLSQWHSPPFAPVIRGDYLFARGATDDKGQLFAHVKALETWLATTGRLPVNVVCLFEGEEEIGSSNLLRFIAAHGEAMGVDLAVVSDTTMPAPERPAIVHSLRGNLGLELEVTGQPQELHSGLYGGMVHNPVHALCEILARFHDSSGRIAIPGFYDRVRHLSHGEREQMRRSGPADAELLALAGTAQGWGEHGYNLYERTTIRPCLNVTGISGGFQGTGVKGIIPARATAKLDIRLAPSQNPAEVERLFRQFFTRMAPPHLTLLVSTTSSAKPIEMDLSHPCFRAAESACRLGFGHPPVYLRSGGTIPVVAAMRENLGIPVMLLGFGLANARIHAADETLYLPNFFKGIATSAHLLAELGRMKVVRERH